MATTTLKTRIQHKYNTLAVWAENASFVPLKGEICVFNNGAGAKPEMKIGDGTTTLASLPFLKAGSDIQINSGSTNGTISVSIDGSAKDVAVKGLGARAFDNTSYLPLSGGTLTGPLTISGGSDLYLKAATGTDAGDIVFVKPDGSEYIRLWSQTGTNLLIRFGSSDSAKNIIHSGNYTDYTVTKTGSGASGTWSISITGNAARANALEGSGNLIFTGDHLLQSVSRPNCQLHFGTDRLYTHDANGYQIIWRQGDSITGAVWNDYAEYRESDCAEFGRVLAENGDDTLSPTTERLQHFAGISSDTWGFCQGETEKAKTPIAVAGRVLAYPYRDRNKYKPGDCVCAAPNGTVDIMTREEVEHYPDRIVGTVSCVPEYEEWGQGDRPAVKVDGRIWIKVK